MLRRYVVFLSLLPLLLQYALVVAKKENKVKVKIVEAPALNRFPSMPSSSEKIPKRRADPSPLSGPPHLLQLHDHCYSNSYHGYMYKACLFNNITQKEERAGWNRFHGVLGVWHEWIIKNDTFVGMHYTVGDHCGTQDREAKVMFRCSVKTELHNFTEPHTCSYHMVLDTPLACFPGAMQVYHVLSPEQLKAWEELDRLYYEEELTHKGLSKRRKDILIEAGLLQKDKKPTLDATPPSHHNHPPPPQTPPPSSPSELAKCQEEVKKLEELFVKVKNHSLRVLSDYPELQNKISAVFLLNKGLEAYIPMKAMKGIQSNATATTTARGGEGMAGREHLPQGPDSNLPQGPDSNLPQGPDSNLPQGPDSNLPQGPDSNLPQGPDTKLSRGPNQPLQHERLIPPEGQPPQQNGVHNAAAGDGGDAAADGDPAMKEGRVGGDIAGEDGRKEEGRHQQREEQEGLMDEKELEQLVADIGGDEKQQVNNAAVPSRQQERNAGDGDIDKAINDLDLDGIL